MQKARLFGLVLEEFGQIYTKLEVVVRTENEVYPTIKNSDGSMSVRVNLLHPPVPRDIGSFLDFWYHEKEKRLGDVWLRLTPSLRGKGLARNLVEAMEKLAGRLNCEKVRIDLVTNQEFWQHLGYQPVEDYLEKSCRSQ